MCRSEKRNGTQAVPYNNIYGSCEPISLSKTLP